MEGAIKVVATPLAVVVGLKEPHAESPQVTVHITWGLAEKSLLIVALKDTVSLTWRDEGGANEMEIGG